MSLMTCQMMRVISSPSSSTTGLTTLIFLMPVVDAILICASAVYGWLLVKGAVVQRNADVAVVEEESREDAKAQCWPWKGRRASDEAAARIPAAAVMAGLMACRYSLGKLSACELLGVAAGLAYSYAYCCYCSSCCCCCRPRARAGPATTFWLSGDGGVMPADAAAHYRRA